MDLMSTRYYLERHVKVFKSDPSNIRPATKIILFYAYPKSLFHLREERESRLKFLSSGECVTIRKIRHSGRAKRPSSAVAMLRRVEDPESMNMQ
jgi:hypothetical protein